MCRVANQHNPPIVAPPARQRQHERCSQLVTIFRLSQDLVKHRRGALEASALEASAQIFHVRQLLPGCGFMQGPVLLVIEECVATIMRRKRDTVAASA